MANCLFCKVAKLAKNFVFAREVYVSPNHTLIKLALANEGVYVAPTVKANANASGSFKEMHIVFIIKTNYNSNVIKL